MTGTVNYIYDIAGDQVAEVNSSGSVNREEVYGAGKHLATYANSTTYFNEGDWLGTERARSGVNGSICETITGLPFGDGMNTSGSCSDPGPMHFTGKQRDGESGLDDFDARYYGSGLGRFTSPDWSAHADTVPYAEMYDPQSLNLYAYVGNNPLGKTDATGHCGGNVGWLASNGYVALAVADSCGASTATVSQLERGMDIGSWYQVKAKQTYGRQSDGSYKADPAKVQQAIDAKKPIGDGQCVTACSDLSGVTKHTASWEVGRSILDLNDTTDVGLAVASFGEDKKFVQAGQDQNSAIYMGHDPKTGQIIVVDQFPPPNPKRYNAPFKHALESHGPGHNLKNNRMENNAYYYHVIIVRKGQ